MKPPCQISGSATDVCVLLFPDGSDYVGGPFTVNFGTNADEVQCRQITLISDNEREEREDFFVDVSLPDIGVIRRGDPSRTVVAIEGTSVRTYIEVNDRISLS